MRGGGAKILQLRNVDVLSQPLVFWRARIDAGALFCLKKMVN
jgi:hypothetical protein